MSSKVFSTLLHPPVLTLLCLVVASVSSQETSDITTAPFLSTILTQPVHSTAQLLQSNSVTEASINLQATTVPPTNTHFTGSSFSQLWGQCDQVSQQQYNFTIFYQCNRYRSYEFLDADVSDDGCTFRFALETSLACMVHQEEIYNFISNNTGIFSTFLILIGVLFCFFSLKKIYFTSYALTFFSFLAGGTVVMFILLAPSTGLTQFWGWFFFGTAFLAALIFTIVIYKNLHSLKIDRFFAGSWVGILVSCFINSTLYLMVPEEDKSHVFLVTLIVLGLLTGLLAHFFFVDVLLVASSIFGTFAALLGLSLLLGFFPPEILDPADTQLGAIYYCNMVFFTMILGMSLFYQYGRSGEYIKLLRLNEKGITPGGDEYTRLGDSDDDYEDDDDEDEDDDDYEDDDEEEDDEDEKRPEHGRKHSIKETSSKPQTVVVGDSKSSESKEVPMG